MSDFSSGKRVLFVCHDFPPFKWAGAQLYAFHLAKELRTIGHEVRVFHPVDLSTVAKDGRKPGDMFDAEVEGVPVTRLVVDDTSSNLAIHPQYTFASPMVEQRFAEFLRANPQDIVHIHLLYRLSGGLPRIARESGAKTIATLHDYWLLCAMGHQIDSRGRECGGPETPEKCARCLNGFHEDTADPNLAAFFRDRMQVYQGAWREFDRVLCPSRFLADAHTRYGFPAPEIHPLGWLPIERNERNTDPERVRFGFCGQIVYRKGLDVLIKAFLKVRGKNWELHVYGRPYQETYFTQMKTLLDQHPRMEYKGAFTPEDLPAIYSTLDVAVMPSRRENYPLTLMEGLSAGVPMIASNVGGVPEMMENERDGFIFPNEDADRLAEIIEDILANPESLKEMRAGIRRPKTIAEDAREMVEIYAGIER